MKRKAFKKIGLILSSCLLAFTLIACSLMEAMGKEIPLTDLAAEYKGEATDENGNLLAPFDVVYPEAFESGEYEYDKTSVLLKMRKTFNGRVTTNIRNCGIYKMDKFLETKDGDWYRAKIKSDEDVTTVIKKTRSLSEILMSDYDYIYEEKDEEWEVSNPTVDCTEALHEKVQNNENAGQQWYLTSSGIQQAWKFLEKEGYDAGGSSSVTVAVIDTGVDYTHPDLVDNMWVNSAEIPNNGIDDDDNGFIDDVHGANVIANNGYGDMANTGNPMDDHGHGTHVAGIVAATNNKQGIVGVAYNAKIMAVKAGQATGVFLQSDIAEAILYAYSMGADVINMSFGGSACSIPVQDALMQAYTTCTLVAAAGNDGQPNEWADHVPPFKILPSYPGALSYVVGVMSVDYRGVESAFTNWDVLKYNITEYEVYAPGEAILSTLPGGRYGKLNGTSMAAPVVSGVAALLRSYYTDRDMYPSKFIAAQLSATSEDNAICCNPQMHTINGYLHNIPMMVNAYDALTKLPRPETYLNNYYLFDDKELSSKNNGDGVVDAGEIINIAPILRNGWGMSKDTIITIDAITGIDGLDLVNPYVEIITGTLNYDSVGTYSTKDFLIREESIVVGCEKPWVIKIADNCPNDYLISLNVTTSCNNALDEKDDETYVIEQDGAISFTVRNGVILPSQIKEDMTLTKDNYYIIPNATYIAPGVTVTVEPGTKIQFWSDDPSDPYADEYMAYLNVAGNFITQGTVEEPVLMFPSDMMDRYIVDIRKTSSGYVNLSYTTITNPRVNYNLADHCTFNQYYYFDLWHRKLENGSVYVDDLFIQPFIAGGKTTNSIFYKLSGGVYYNYRLGGNFDTCSFIDSSINFNYPHHIDELHGSLSSNYENCVFVGNHALSEDGYILNSSLDFNYSYMNEVNIKSVFRDNETGTTYLLMDYVNPDRKYFKEFLESIGGNIACIESNEEMQLIRSNLTDWYLMDIGIDLDTSFSKWGNGEDFNLNIETYDANKYYYASLSKGGYISDCHITTTNILSNLLIEIPGEIYCESIYICPDSSMFTYSTENSIELRVETYPVDYDKSKLVYISGDENIATVDEFGVVTPLKEGTVNIYVYSSDFNAWTSQYLTFVKNVPVEDFEVNLKYHTMDVGEILSMDLELYPSNTTEKDFYIESSNPEVVSVNNYNKTIYANKVGSVTITVIVGNITKEIEITVENKIESISFEEKFYITYLTDTDDSWKPKLSPVDATNVNLNWVSSNPEIAYVNEDGELIRVSEGVTTIRVEEESSKLYADLIVSVLDQNTNIQNEITQIDYHNGNVYAILNKNELWGWGVGSKTPKLIATGIKSFATTNMGGGSGNYNYDYVYVIYSNGDVYRLCIIREKLCFKEDYFNKFFLTNGEKVIRTYGSSHFVIKTDGSVWGIGDNHYGQLGDGSTIDKEEFVQMQVGNAVDVVGNGEITCVLDNSGDLYAFGRNCFEGLKVESGVESIHRFVDNIVACKKDGTSIRFCDVNVIYRNGNKEIVYNECWSIKNGKVVYTKYYDDDKVYDLSKINNAAYICVEDGSYFIVTKDGQLYGVGNNNNYVLGDLTTNHRYEACKIFFNINDDGIAPFISDNHLNDNVLSSQTLKLAFQKPILTSSNYSYITLKDSSDNTIAIRKTTDLNNFIVSGYAQFANNETYTLTIPANSFTSVSGVPNEEIVVTFTYKNDTQIEFVSGSISDGEIINSNNLDVTFNYTFAEKGENFNSIKVIDKEGKEQIVDVVLSNSELSLTGTLEFGEYSIVIPENALKDNVGGYNEETIVSFVMAEKVNLIESSIENGDDRVDETKDITFTFTNVTAGQNITNIQLKDSLGKLVSVAMTLENNVLTIDHDGLKQNEHYTLLIPEDTVKDYLENGNEEISIEFTTYSPIEIIASSLSDERVHYYHNPIRLYLNGDAELYEHDVMDKGPNPNIIVKGEDDEYGTYFDINNRVINIGIMDQLKPDTTYKLVVKEGTFYDEKGNPNEYYEQEFTTIKIEERFFYELEDFEEIYSPYKGYNVDFYNNSILNNFNDTNVEHWLRLQAKDYENNTIKTYHLSGNYWGTTNEKIIDKQIVDFDDYQSLNDIDVGDYLTVAPSNTFPFVTKITLINSNGEITTTVSNETVTFIIEFNRDMDTSLPLRVRFGSAIPYADYEIEGEYVNPREWQGTYTLKTTIENGNQYFNISNGRAADDHYLTLAETQGRFTFELDTSLAQAMIMQAEATKEGINLTWEQDDFDTLAGFNVYRSEQEDGYYERVNDYVIPYDTKEFFDNTVEPGKVYYYNFTVVKTDLSESTPSGKVIVRSLDTMAPNVYHSPIKVAYTESNLLVAATITDNLQVDKARLYYRITGTDEWKSVEMSVLNSRYTGIIPSEYITLAGVEYYISAYDGMSYTYKGSAENPYAVIVKVTIGKDSYGDVDGDGAITAKDALMLLQAANDQLNLTDDQFRRADINKDGVLSASEALRILQYVSGKINSIVD